MAPPATDGSGIRQRVDTLVEAIRAADLDRVMSAYAADIVSFDVEPPLQHVAAQAKRKNWAYRRDMAHRPRSGVGAARFGERASVAESEALSRTVVLTAAYISGVYVIFCGSSSTCADVIVRASADSTIVMNRQNTSMMLLP